MKVNENRGEEGKGNGLKTGIRKDTESCKVKCK